MLKIAMLTIVFLAHDGSVATYTTPAGDPAVCEQMKKEFIEAMNDPTTGDQYIGVCSDATVPQKLPVRPE